MNQVAEVLLTGAGMFGKALWALLFGYIISSAIQAVITTEWKTETLNEITRFALDYPFG